MTPAAAKANLLDSYKKLRVRWARVREVWNDDAAKQFEADYIEPLAQKITIALKGLDHADEVLTRVRHECAD